MGFAEDDWHCGLPAMAVCFRVELRWKKRYWCRNSDTRNLDKTAALAGVPQSCCDGAQALPSLGITAD